MAIKTVTVCDGCKQRIEDRGASYLQSIGGDLVVHEMGYDENGKEAIALARVDLCLSCAEILRRLLQDWLLAIGGIE